MGASKPSIPSYLLAPCDHPTVYLEHNEELVNSLVAYKAALDSCNNDKQTVREYLEGY